MTARRLKLAFGFGAAMIKLPVLVVVVGVSLAAFASEPARLTSEDAVLTYATTPYERVDKPRVELGQLNGTSVIAEFICSDVCPDYTVRVIHYQLRKDQTCNEAGGIEKAIRIPVGIGATDKTFCFPKVLVSNWKAYQRKLSFVPSGVGPHE